MMNFETPLDQLGAPRRLVLIDRTESAPPAPQPVVQQAVEPVVVANESRRYLLQPRDAWGWEALRDYVVDQIERRTGPFPRNPGKEYGIFSGFVQRWGSQQAAAIARYAFEELDGRWMSSPVSIFRFCKNSDTYFARPIAEILERETALVGA
jgi:hypothetical protein